jgi:hypothetical protein
MDWKADTPLRNDMRANPIMWVEQLKADVRLPRISRGFIEQVFAAMERTSIAIWGRRDGKLSAHFLASNRGLTLHTDPGAARYSVQLQLHNEGWMTSGVGVALRQEDPRDYPMLTPGTIILLDTHSPHQVTKDPRLPQRGPFKLTAVIDSPDEPDRDEAVAALIERLRDPPRVPRGKDAV